MLNIEFGTVCKMYAETQQNQDLGWFWWGNDIIYSNCVGEGRGDFKGVSPLIPMIAQASHMLSSAVVPSPSSDAKRS